MPAPVPDCALLHSQTRLLKNVAHGIGSLLPSSGVALTRGLVRFTAVGLGGLGKVGAKNNTLRWLLC